MPFTFHRQDLAGLTLIEPTLFHDERGVFLEAHKHSDFEGAGITERFVQDSISISKRGVLRGIHYQVPPKAQGKLVMATHGRVWDVCVDLRRDSETFGQWRGFHLDAEQFHMLYLPAGFGHGFVALSESARVLYKCTAEYAPDCERGIRWDDPDLTIDWPTRDVLVSDKDAALPYLRDAAVFVGDGA